MRSPWLAIGAMLLVGGCSALPRWAGGRPAASPVEQLYASALTHLDTASSPASLDSAIYFLDRYLVSAHRQEHHREAMLIRRLAHQARDLRRVEALLLQAKADGERRVETRGGDVEQRRSDGDGSVREIQRLKDELAKANAELERIRRRLANPREP